MKNLTLVIGCGRLGASIADYVCSAGSSVAILDQNKTSFDRLSSNYSGHKVVGNASDAQALEDAGIEDSREVIIATGNDNVNLYVAYLAAKIYEVPYVYVRFDDPDQGLLIQGLSVKAIYPFQLSLDRLALLRAGVEEK